MKKDEIKSLIAAKIAGQGTNVDAGSVLPTILNGIIDLIPSGPSLVFDADAMGLSAGDLMTKEQEEMFRRASLFIYQNRVFQRLETTVAWKFINDNSSVFPHLIDSTPIFGFEYVIENGEFTGGIFVYYDSAQMKFMETEI